MKYSTIEPPAHVKQYIRTFWVLESDLTSYTHREVAGIYPELLFHYKGRFHELKADGSRESSFISGLHAQTASFTRFHINESFAMFGVCLYPYTLPVLFGIPSYEVTGGMPDVSALFGREGRELEEQMLFASDNFHRVRIAVSFFEQKMYQKTSGVSPVLSSLHTIVQYKGNIKVNELACRCNLSSRQFERTFKHFSGFNPKLFARITRFYTAVDQYHHSGQKTLTQIAHDCGYYDQSHFIQDFKTFSGHNPKDFFYKSAEGTEWLNAQ